MKNCISFFLVFFLCSSAASQSITKDEQAPLPPPAPGMNQEGKSTLLHENPVFGELLSKVTVSTTSFNPSRKGEVALQYHIADKAKVTVNVYDPVWGLVKALVKEELQDAGDKSLTWDGRDDQGMVVPDEAYFFTISAEDEAGNKEIYDPVTFSGGVSHDIVNVDIDQENHTINYRMPEMGRVMIRVGIQGGPLMNTVVDWQPRVRGAITEYWNGKDNNGLVDLYTTPRTKMIVTYFSLPETSVITYGNREADYRSHKRDQSDNVVVKPDRGILTENVSHHYRLPRKIDHAPSLTINFSNSEQESGIVVLKEKSIVNVDLVDEDKDIFKNQQFEICFFLDHEFYAEDEVGYTPFNWVWDLAGVKAGEHILTVNVSGFRDQVGVVSRRVKIVKEN